MSVSRRVVLSVGLLMLLALGVLGYQLYIVIRMQNINNQLSKVSFVAASHLLQMEQDVDELEDLSARYVSLGEPRRKGLEQALDDRIESFDSRFRELDKGLQPWEAPEEITSLSTAWIQYKSQLEGTRSMLGAGGLDALPPTLKDAIDNVRTQTQSARSAMLASMEAEVKRNQSMGDQAVSISRAAAAVFLVMGATITFVTLRAINSSPAGTDSRYAKHCQWRIFPPSSREWAQ